MLASNMCLGITIIVLDNVFKIWIELITLQNHNDMENSIGLSGFQKLKFSAKFQNIRNTLKNNEFAAEGVPAPRDIRAGTRLTVHRSLPY